MSISFTPLMTGYSSSDGDAHSRKSIDTGVNWPTAVIASTGAIAGCALIAIVIWQLLKTARKSMESRGTTEAGAADLARVSQNVTDLGARLADIEKVLRTVE